MSYFYTMNLKKNQKIEKFEKIEIFEMFWKHLKTKRQKTWKDLISLNILKAFEYKKNNKKKK